MSVWDGVPDTDIPQSFIKREDSFSGIYAIFASIAVDMKIISEH